MQDSMAEAARVSMVAWQGEASPPPGRVTRLKLPVTISVAVFGAVALSGCGKPSDNVDGGPKLCPDGCGVLLEADGGVYRTADGGVECLC